MAAPSLSSRTSAPSPPARATVAPARTAASSVVPARAASIPPSAAMAGEPALRLNPALRPSSSTEWPEPVRRVIGAPGPGEPLRPGVRARLERTLDFPLGGVRVHTDDLARQAVNSLGARAFTHGTHVFLGRNESPSDLALMGHEVAHVIQQQGAPAVRMFQAAPAGDRFEAEAARASSAAQRGERASIQGRTDGPRVQGLGIRDALDYFANAANNIPGFAMLTFVIGINPINMQRVERNATNLFRAIIGFLPGGNLIFEALQNHGILERVGNWARQQLASLGMAAQMFRDALDRFMDSLSWRDIFDLGGVWNRARRIFSEPIDRLIAFVRGLAGDILRFIKDAILMPLARLAQGTRGWDLLCAVLGRNPITNEPSPRTAETLIGGFMRLIGQEEVWQNIQRGNAVARAWAWFQGALAGVLGFVREIPSLFVRTLQSLEILDIVLVPRAFLKVATVFGGFALRFISWAGEQVMRLLEIIFEVVAPQVMVYLRRAAGALRTIIRDPIRFIGNLVRAGLLGLRQFAGNFLTHLRASLIGWLTGAMSGANIYIPQAFNLREIIKFVLSVLGLTWQNIRSKLVRAIGETAVAALETGFDIVVTLVRDGPAAAWQKIVESINNLREMVMEQVMTFARDRIVQAAITRLVTSLNPAGAFIQAIIAIYNTVMFFVERLRQIAQVAAAVIDSISAIAAGVIGAAANRVEQTMAGLLTLVISFLARIAGLGRVSDAVTNIINRVRQPIDRALDRVVEWIVGQARRLGRLLAGGAGGRAGAGARGDIDRPVTLARERHTVRARGEGRRLQVLMSSNGFMGVEQELANVRRHFVDAYLPAMNRADEASVLGTQLDSIAAQKNQWVNQYNAAPDAQKDSILQSGLAALVQRFQVVNQALETFIGPWATVRVGDTIVYDRGGNPEYATVTEVMVRVGGHFGLKARPVHQAPGGRKLPKSLRVSGQSADVVLSPLIEAKPYAQYGARWQKFSGNVPMMPGARDNPFVMIWPKPWWDGYPTLYFGSPRSQTTQATLRSQMGVDPTIQAFPPSGGALHGGTSIGIRAPYQLAPDSVIGPLSNASTPGGGVLINILRPYGFDPVADGLQVDHVQDIGLGGANAKPNLWPLPQSINSAAGGAMSNARVTVPGTSATIALRDLRRLTSTNFYFKLRR